MSPPPDKEHKDEHKDEKKDEKKDGKKKSFGEKLATIALAVLFLVIFLYVLNALLGMFFPAAAETVGISANGMRNIGMQLTNFSASFSVFMTGLIQLVVKLLLLILLGLLGFKLAKQMIAWSKS